MGSYQAEVLVLTARATADEWINQARTAVGAFTTCSPGTAAARRRDGTQAVRGRRDRPGTGVMFVVEEQTFRMADFATVSGVGSAVCFMAGGLADILPLTLLS